MMRQNLSAVAVVSQMEQLGVERGIVGVAVLQRDSFLRVSSIANYYANFALTICLQDILSLSAPLA